jgi:REP element-mobilizing transposase RayT
MVFKYWKELPNKFKHIMLDEFVVMPNHIHGIIFVGADLCVSPSVSGAHAGAPLQRKSRPFVGDVIRWLKTMTTNAYLRNVKNAGWPPLPGKLWQRNYYEHIIRNNVELKKIRHYIRSNPRNWDKDTENPLNK